jgi:hypothetical protein
MAQNNIITAIVMLKLHAKISALDLEQQDYSLHTLISILSKVAMIMDRNVVRCVKYSLYGLAQDVLVVIHH